MNPYTTLGIEPGSDAQALRAAYRKLVKTTHPDVDRTEGAKERFEALRTAFEEALRISTGTRPSPLHPRRHRVVSVTVEITVAEALAGKSVVLPATSGICSCCEGSGRVAVDYPTYCASCGGSGTIATKSRGFSRVSLQCHECGGTGNTQALECGRCAGYGVEERVACTVEVPPNVMERQILYVEGAAGIPAEGVDGDMEVTVLIRDPEYVAFGSTINATVAIDILTASEGGFVKVRHPTGRTYALKVPPGTESGRRFRLAGKGFPARGEDPAGDFMVTVQIMPVDLSDEAVVEAMRALRSALEGARR